MTSNNKRLIRCLSDKEKNHCGRVILTIVRGKTIAERIRILEEAGDEILKNYVTKAEYESRKDFY